MPISLDNIKILYSDKSLLIVEKPVGLPSQKDLKGGENLLDLLNEKNKDVYLIHRLDTATGGVMVYARGKKAAAALSELVQNHEVFEKTYLAVLENIPEEKEGELVDYLFHDKRQNKSFISKKSKKDAKEAKLAYVAQDQNEKHHSLVKIRLYTGRTHQIRIQFASRKLPLYGDGKYGAHEKMKGFALWAYRIRFPHPFTKEIIEATSYPPVDGMPWNQFEIFPK